jgi:hypothetical protein
VYRLYSEQVTKAVAECGPVATRYLLYKAMRGVKGDVLVLLTNYIEAFHESEVVVFIDTSTISPQLSRILSFFLLVLLLLLLPLLDLHYFIFPNDNRLGGAVSLCELLSPLHHPRSARGFPDLTAQV